LLSDFLPEWNEEIYQRKDETAAVKKKNRLCIRVL